VRDRKKTGCAELYDIYRLTSTDGTHASAISIDRHIKVDEHGNFKNFVFGPTHEGVIEVLEMAMFCMIYAFKAMSKVFPENQFETTFASWFKNLNQFQSETHSPIVPQDSILSVTFESLRLPRMDSTHE
jgi:hypothetical protein